MATDQTRQQATAESLVARCLLDPGYLSEHLREGADPLTVGGEALDLTRVRLFGGLITKVQHNDLWEDFRYTRASLKLLGAELEFFAAYRDEFLQARAEHPDRIARVDRFLQALERWLGEHWSAAAWTAWDVLRHERATWQTLLAVATREGVDLQNAHEMLRPNGVVSVVGFDHGPPQIMEAIRSAGSLAEVPTRPTFLCYWGRAEPPEVRVLEVDGLTALLLDAVGDGVAPEDLHRTLQQANPQFTPHAVAIAVRAAVDLGVLQGRAEPQSASEVHR